MYQIYLILQFFFLLKLNKHLFIIIIKKKILFLKYIL